MFLRRAVFVLFLVCLWGVGFEGVALAQDTGEPAATGLKPMTPEEVARLRQMFPGARHIRPNRRALDLINRERRGRGAPALTERDIAVAPDGQEAVSEEPSGSALAAAGEEPVPTGFPEWSPPALVDNSKEIWFPPIRSQGSIGSCVSWGITYYQHTYETARLLGRNAKSGDNTLIFSPKWTYNMVNDGVDNGSNMSETFDILIKHGAATWAQFPYDSSYTQWCLDSATWQSALRWRLGSRTGIYSLSTTNGLNQLRQSLANGYVCSFGTYVTSWTYTTIKDDPSTTNDNLYVGQRICPYMNGTVGGHIMTFVGYSDDVWCDVNGNGTVDDYETGAFKLANSWGTGDWNGGYRWVAYDAFAPASRVAGASQSGRVTLCQSDAAYYTTVKVHSPTLYARFTVNHAKRTQMSMQLGLSNTTATNPATTWSPNALSTDGGNLAFDGSTTARDGTFVMDFTDLNPPIGVNQRYWLRGYDSTAGDPLTIKAFSLVDVWGQEFPASPANFLPTNGVVDAGGVSPGKAWVDHVCSTNPPESTQVRVAATDPEGAELGGDPAAFTVTRVDPLTGAGLTAGALPVQFSLTGTASEGADYQTVGGLVTIPDGASNAVVSIVPLQDTAVEGNETVTLGLIGVPGSYFVMPAGGSASVAISDDDSRLTIAATDATASEGGSDTGTYTFTRSGGTDGALTVYYSVDPASTAASNDYVALPGSLSFTNRQSARTLTLTPVNDTIPELDETVIVRIDANAGYAVGSPSSATVTILRNDNAVPTVTINWPKPSYVLASGETATVVLQAAVTDDGNPSNSLAIAWTRQSGPAAATFADPNSPTTTVHLAEPGTYILRLTANDGWTQGYDQVAILLSTNLAADQYGGPADGLAMWLKLDDGAGSVAVDASANNRNGELQGGVAWTNGHIRGGLNFFDSDDKVIVNPAVPMGAAWTVCSWFTAPLPTGASWNTLTRGSSADHHVIVQNGLMLGTYVGSFYGCGFNMADLAPGWHHLAAVGSGTTTVFYVDGSLVGTAYKKTANDVYCVGNYQSNGQRFTDRLDDVRLYNRALTADEVGSLFSREENVAPVVHAGPDVETSTAVPAALHGTVVDDGRPVPPGAVTVSWSRVSGPGAVSFNPADAADTLASCGTAGSQVLRLTADDGQVKMCEDVAVSVISAIPGITLLETDGRTEVREHGGGSSDTYRVRLNTQPSATVTVTLSGDPEQATVSPALLTFTTGNWSEGQTCTVTAVDDSLEEGPHGCEIRHVASSSDGQYDGLVAVLSVSIVDNDVNNLPVAQADACSLPEDSGPVFVDVLANDLDPDGDTLMVWTVLAAGHGATGIAAGGGGATYRPAANYHGPDSFSCVVSDGRGGFATGTVSVTVTAVNDAPVAWNDLVTLAEDSPATPVPVLANDTDVDNDPLRVAGVTQGSHGTVAITGGGSGLTYQPVANYHGPDLFTYAVTDDQGGWSTGSVAVSVTAVNDAPVAQSQTLSTLEGAPLAITLAGTDVDGDELSCQVTAAPTKGALLGQAPALVYRPNAGASGADSFSFRVNDGQVNSANAVVSLSVTDAFGVKINFQPAASPTPAGFLADAGAVFGDRANGFSYGWAKDNTANLYAAGVHTNPCQDTYGIMNEGNNATQWEAPWELTVPRGPCIVRVMAGNPLDSSSTHSISVEGERQLLGTVTPDNPFIEAVFVGVDVQDGRLTLDNGGGQVPIKNANAICFVEVSNATNSAPAIQAGTNQVILSSVASLDGTVADDGLPVGGTVTVTWSRLSGPGSVSFGDAHAVDTTATFGALGEYVLCLTAGDGEREGQATVIVTVDTDTDGDGIPDSRDPDADGDGMPDGWETDNGLDPRVSDANADPDQDGLSNYQEYIAGTCPTNPFSCLGLVELVAGEDPSFSFWTVPGRLYRVDWLADLAPTSIWQTVFSNLVGDGNLQWLTHSNRLDRSFYRLNVRKPE